MITSGQLTGIVLAGGKSSRFGSNKAMQNIGEETFLWRATQLLQPICKEVLISGDKAEYVGIGIRMIKDIYEGCGPLGGIHAGLRECQTPFALFLTCDMPMMSHEPLLRMMEKEEVCVVGWNHRETGGGVFPLIVSVGILNEVEYALKNGAYSIKKSLLENDHVRMLDIPDRWEQLFLNVNRKEDLQYIR